MDVLLSHDSNNLAHLRLPPRVNNQTITIHTSNLKSCDCTSYFYFFLSLLLIVLGTFITVTALGGTHHTLFSNLGHMWSVGPICVCCGIMIAIKSLLYLRSKRDLQERVSLSMQMLFRLEEERRLRFIEELRRAESSSMPLDRHVYALVEDIIVQRHNLNRNTDSISGGERHVFIDNHSRNRPPAYDVVIRPDIEAPPPSYEEAIALIAQQKNDPVPSANPEVAVST